MKERKRGKMKALNSLIGTPRRAIAFVLFIFFIWMWIMMIMIPETAVETNAQTLITASMFFFLKFIAVPLIVVLLAVLIFNGDVF